MWQCNIQTVIEVIKKCGNVQNQAFPVATRKGPSYLLTDHLFQSAFRVAKKKKKKPEALLKTT